MYIDNMYDMIRVNDDECSSAVAGDDASAVCTLGVQWLAMAAMGRMAEYLSGRQPRLGDSFSMNIVQMIRFYVHHSSSS